MNKSATIINLHRNSAPFLDTNTYLLDAADTLRQYYKRNLDEKHSYRKDQIPHFLYKESEAKLYYTFTFRVPPQRPTQNQIETHLIREIVFLLFSL